MFRFEYSDVLYALLAIPVFVFLFYLLRKKRQKLLKKYGDISIISHLFLDTSKYKPIVKFSILLFAFAMLIIGIANPQIGTRQEEIKREGIDIMIALDVSNSMKAEDIKPNRLERAKMMINHLIDKLSNDRIGIIVFAGSAYLQVPITTDFSAAKLFLSAIDTDIVPVQGTAIGAAIELSMNTFKQDNKKNKALIIITDGENHEDDAVGAASEAAKIGAIVYTIGMGTVSGAPIPVYSNNTISGYKKDSDGNAIFTKLDAVMLQQIAEAGQGKFIRSADNDADLMSIVKDINKLEKEEISTKLFTDYESRFQYPIALAIILLIIELLISDRKNKLINSLNLFGVNKNEK